MSFMPIETEPGRVRRATSIRHLRVTQERVFGFLGERIRVQVNHPTLLAVAAEALGRFDAAALPPLPPLTLQLFVRDTPPGHATAPFRVKPVYHQQGHLFYIHFGPENNLIVDLQQGFGLVVVSPALLAEPVFLRQNLIETAAYAMIGMARDYVALHAAAIHLNGQTLLLTGPSGVGKSTLAYAAIRQGWQALSDDVVQVKLWPDAYQLWGMPWKFHLLPDAVRFFPELADLTPEMQTNGEWKLAVDLEQYFPGSTLAHASRAQFVFLERAAAGAAPHLERLSPAAARERFEVIWSWEIGWKEWYDEQLSYLVEQGAYQLFIGPSPEETAQCLSEITSAEGTTTPQPMARGRAD